MRQWLNWLKLFLGGDFYKNKFLTGIWKFVLGINFVDLSDKKYVLTFFKFLRNFMLHRKCGLQNFERFPSGIYIEIYCQSNQEQNAIDKKYRDREIKLKELLHEFHDLTFEDQMSKLEFYCTEFGVYTSDQEASDYGKVSEPSLSEIQEVQSASFLSFRDFRY